jgi:PAS domain S-box-containing protein
MTSDQDIGSSIWTSEKKIEVLNLLPIGILAFDKDGLITYSNNNAIKFGIVTSNENDSLIGINLLTNNIIENFFLSEHIEGLKDGETFEYEIKSRKTIDGGFISVILKGSALYTEDIFDGGLIIIEDVHINKVSGETSSTEIKEYLEVILYQAFDLVLLIDLNENIIYSTGKSKNIILPSRTGEKEIIFSDLFSDSNIQTISKSYQSTIRSKKETTVIISLHHHRDEPQSYEVSFLPILSEKNKVVFVSVYLKNISAQLLEKDNYERVISELSQYQIITEATTDAIVTIDKSGNILFWNKSADKLFGYTRSQVYSKEFAQIIKVTEEKAIAEILSRLNRSKSVRRKLSFFTKKEERKTGEFYFSKIAFENGDEAFVVLIDDITESERIEQELRLSEERFRNIVQNTSDLICNFDANGKLLYTNPAFLEALKISTSDLRRVKITDFFDPEFLEQRKFNIRQLVESKTLSYELPVFTTQGEKLFLSASFSTVYDADNSIKFFNGIFKDITLRKNTEQELLLMRSIFDASNDGIAMELEGKFILANNSFAQIFGYDNGTKMEGLDSIDIVAEEDRDRILQYSEARNLGNDVPGRYDFLGKRNDGSHFHVEVSVTYFIFNEKTFFVIIARDITERKRVQQAIKESELRYRSITENIDDFFWTAERVDSKLRTMFYTASVEKVTGFTQADFLSDSRLFFKIIYPDDYSIVKKRLKKLFANYYKQSDEIEFRIINKHGSVVWVQNKINVVREKSGRVTKVYGLVSDISLQKKAEEELKQSTQNLQKLNETKDRFISIISHDLRTPFSSILGFTDLLLQDDELTNEEKRQYITFIQDSSKTMLSLVNSLMDWTRLQTGRIKFEPEKTDIRSIVQKSFASLSGFAMQKNINLIDTIDSELFLFVDQNLVLQAFNNLISNSLKFTPQNGLISVSAIQSESARFIQITIKDNGVGIAQENLHKIFNVDAKFTSEGTAGEKGTGLGLSLVKEIVDKHGGIIWVESEHGKGTEFKFTLPKASASILLVDDSNTDRILYSKLLRSITTEYDIITAVNGEEALAKVRTAAPALVITDHAMPKMTGLQFINELKNSDIKGKPPVIVLSSDLGKSEELAYSDAGIEYVFHKPVNLSSFKDAVEKSMRKLPHLN